MTEDESVGLRPQYQTYARQKCFIAYSEQAHWSVDLLAACEEVLSQPEYNLEVDYARKHFEADIPLRQKALDLIANARYGIYDISSWRQDERSPLQTPRNVMIELGIAIALNRPVLLLRHSSNRELPLPRSLECISDQILEFGGITTLKKALAECLPKWINTAPEAAWWNRYCIFGGRNCDYREAHPKAKQLEKKKLGCAIADGSDSSRSDFRSTVEEVLDRFSDVAYIYLDSLLLREGYNILLCSHCQMIRSSPFTIYRITSETPVEAFISIGINIALETRFEYKIPKIFITEDAQNIPSLLSGSEVIVARSDKELKNSLKNFVPEVIKKVRGTFWKPKPIPFLQTQPHQLNIELYLTGDLEKYKELKKRRDQLIESLRQLEMAARQDTIVSNKLSYQYQATKVSERIHKLNQQIREANKEILRKYLTHIESIETLNKSSTSEEKAQIKRVTGELILELSSDRLDDENLAKIYENLNTYFKEEYGLEIKDIKPG